MKELDNMGKWFRRNKRYIAMAIAILIAFLMVFGSLAAFFM
jgi:predicted negative regulator of RcsB-dependent stress response